MADPISRQLNTIRQLVGKPAIGRIGYNPGPGIYSRLERAVEAMPANVRVQELPGLIRRYKDGVPGWELREVDFPGLVGDSAVVPRKDLLDRVRERSPVYTHREVVLGGRPQSQIVDDGLPLAVLEDLQKSASPLGHGVSHGFPRYEDYGQGGQNYAELLLLQPGQVGMDPDMPGLGFGSHWAGRSGAPSADRAVAHARYDTHGDALRINELQSDLGIHNRKVREAAAREELMGPEAGAHYRNTEGAELAFPLEDAWSDILIKRLALEAARGGHRAIEIASPRDIADKVGGNIDNYEHFYGKVVPGALERLGRKMGGLQKIRVPESAPGYFDSAMEMLRKSLEPATRAEQMIASMRPPGPREAFPAFDPEDAFKGLVNAYRLNPNLVPHYAKALNRGLFTDVLKAHQYPRAEAAKHMPELMRLAEERAERLKSYAALRDAADEQSPVPAPPPVRYIMSDEMRRRLLTQGIGASLLAPMALPALQGEE